MLLAKEHHPQMMVIVRAEVICWALLCLLQPQCHFQALLSRVDLLEHFTRYEINTVRFANSNQGAETVPRK